jgi:hypothetical protein
MSVSRRVFVSIDCAEPSPLAEFWAAMLGGEVSFTAMGTALVRSDPISLSMMKVDGYVAPTWPAPDVAKQFHIDLGVTDLAGAAADAVGLGARLAADQPAPESRLILFDPAGHPFCLTTMMPA